MATTNILQKSSDGVAVSHLADSIVFDNGTNVGISTTSPNGKLEISGVSVYNGNAANLDPGAGFSLSFLQNSAKTVIGWNRSSGQGEADFISNRGAGGSSGGFAFYDYDNYNNLNLLLRIKGDGTIVNNLGIGTTPDSTKQLNLYLNDQGTSDTGAKSLSILYNYIGTTQTSGWHWKAGLLWGDLYVGDATHSSKGTVHGLTSYIHIINNGDSVNDESTPLYLGVTARTSERIWGIDHNIQGPCNIQANLLNGPSFMVNNHSSFPVTNGSCGTVIVTLPSAGPEKGPGDYWEGKRTYPIDAGLAIVGVSGTTDWTTVANGFSIALQIGGVAGGWMTSCTMPNPHSLFSTGIDLKDYVNKGIYIHDPQGGAGYALAISANAGNVGIGNTSPTEKLTVTDTQTVSVGDGKGNGGAAEIQIKNPAALLLGLDSKINGNEFLRFATDTRRNWIQSFEATAGNTQSAALTLAAGTTRAIEIDNAGNVGVGNVTAPSQKLDVNGNIKCSGQNILPSYTKTALPTGVTGGMIYVTNDIGGAVPAFFDGTNWRRVIDRNVIS